MFYQHHILNFCVFSLFTKYSFFYSQIMYLTFEISDGLVETCQIAEVASAPWALKMNSTGGNEEVGSNCNAHLSFVRSRL